MVSGSQIQLLEIRSLIAAISSLFWFDLVKKNCAWRDKYRRLRNTRGHSSVPPGSSNPHPVKAKCTVLVIITVTKQIKICRASLLQDNQAKETDKCVSSLHRAWVPLMVHISCIELSDRALIKPEVIPLSRTRFEETGKIIEEPTHRRVDCPRFPICLKYIRLGKSVNFS